jgi:hypothetical protein
MPLIKTLRGTLARLIRWRPARKGEAGYEQRQYVLKAPKTAAEATERISRRLFLTKKGGGKKSLETLAKERRETRPPEVQSKFSMAAFKRRRSFEKKKIYEGESAKDISWFERFKAKRLQTRVNEKGETVGGHHKTEEYARGKAFAERHPEAEKDFLKYVSSPVKKRDRGRRGGGRRGVPRTEREAQRRFVAGIGRRPKTARKAA